MLKPTSRMALCGVMGALSTVCLLLTVFPFATYALPALASVFLFPVVIECGRRYGFLTYVATAVLALLLAPDLEAKWLYVFFFGYYPVLKSVAETRRRPLEWLIKAATFNAAVVAAYFVLIKLGLPLGDFAIGNLPIKTVLLLFLVMGNVIFVLYDIALTRALSLYFVRFGPLLRRWFR